MKVAGLERVERRETGQEKAAGIDDPGVEKRMHRGWRIEGIGQPHVQWKLRRLAHGADEDQQTLRRVAGVISIRPGQSENTIVSFSAARAEKLLQIQCAVHSRKRVRRRQEMRRRPRAA